MRVVVLSPYPERLAKPLVNDQVLGPNKDGTIPDADFVVSFGYRKIIDEATIARFPNRIINAHLGFLPWNRGADPNFWSFFDNTKKGVTIHLIDKGIDTGPIIFQAETVNFKGRNHTLRSTYGVLMENAVKMFSWSWPSIKSGRFTAIPQRTGGSYHKSADKNPWMERLKQGWESPVSAVEALGRKNREGDHETSGRVYQLRGKPLVRPE